MINKATLQHLHLVYLGVVGVDAADAGGDILLTQADSGRGAILCTHLVDSFRELLTCDVDVFLVQTDVAAFLESLIGLRRPSAKDYHRTGEEAARLLQLGIDKSIACSKQHDDHEDAPRHSKSCQRGTQLIATGRLPYFIQ